MPAASTAPERGLVFDISRGCVDDGPGLRTVVFLKGCPLRCPWCHNPEGRSHRPQVAFDDERCLGCGACAAVCDGLRAGPAPHGWRETCEACGRCVEVCPSGARELVGRPMTVPGLLREVLPEAAYLGDCGGGVTFSGGEPLAQAPFLFAAAAALRQRGLHVAVETAGSWDPALAEPLAGCLDLVLLDLKHGDAAALEEATGASLERVLGNLRELRRLGVTVQPRLPLVPGFNTGDADLAALARLLARMDGLPPLVLLPFHRLATSKQRRLGRRYPLADVPAMTRAEVDAVRRRLRRLGVEVAC